MIANDRQQHVAFAIVGDSRDPVGPTATPWGYSGAPQAIVGSLRELGIDVAATSTELPRAWQRFMTNVMAIGFTNAHDVVAAVPSLRDVRLAVRENKSNVLASREMMWMRSAMVRRRLASSGPFDRVIQFGSEYRLPGGTDYITLDDATILQLHLTYDYPWMRVVTERSLARMIARQRQIFMGARACCFLNHWGARSAVEQYGIPPERVHVVGTGRNHPVFSGDRDWSAPHFLFIGKDFERKQGNRVLMAFQQVREAWPNARLDVVGGHPPLADPGVEGHGFLRLEHSGEKLKLTGLFATATCLVLPSLVEPTGNVHAEALAAGIGSIGTAVGGVCTVIGDAGVTVDPHDQSALSENMMRFARPEVAREYGRRARARAPLFTWDTMAQRMLRALALDDRQAEPLAEFL